MIKSVNRPQLSSYLTRIKKSPADYGRDANEPKSETCSRTLVIRSGGILKAYCMNCHSTKEIKDAKKITMNNGAVATQGFCACCKSIMYCIW